MGADGWRKATSQRTHRGQSTTKPKLSKRGFILNLLLMKQALKTDSAENALIIYEYRYYDFCRTQLYHS